jgi:type VI secretion system protein ImpF
MPRTDNEVRITPSVLDRLLDYEPDKSSEQAASRSKSLRDLKDAVRRDLEWLLNSRRTIVDIPEDLTELQSSVAVFGLPDFTGVGAKSPSDQTRLRYSIERAVKIFEPRLERVVVSVVPAEGSERSLRFQIDGMLKVDPAPEPVTFDTLLQLDRSVYVVRGS